MKIKRIFVYGSLREGFYNFDKFLMGRIHNIVSTGTLKGKLFHLSEKGYPALISGDDIVTGEIIDVIDDGNIFDELNELEGYLGPNNPKNDYNLVDIEVQFGSSQKELLPVYLYNSSENTILEKDSGIYIPDGDWKNYMLSKKDQA